MIQILNTPYSNLAAFEATGSEINKDDFTNTLIPHVEEKVDSAGELNYLLLLNTELKNFTLGAWVQDLVLGLKNITKWNRAAIVTDKDSIQNFTDVFSRVMPGTFKGFAKEDLEAAMAWAAGETEID